jgi:hypothetical protein
MYGRVDFHVVDHADVHGGRLLYSHAGDAIGPGRLAAGRHQRIAVHASPEYVQVTEQGPHALLPGPAGQQRLVQDQARSLAGHDRQPLVPGVLDGPERGPHGHGAVWFEHQPGPGIVAPAGERLDQDVHGSIPCKARAIVLLPELEPPFSTITWVTACRRFPHQDSWRRAGERKPWPVRLLLF